jgi:PAS domain S-box-containing protein
MQKPVHILLVEDGRLEAEVIAKELASGGVEQISRGVQSKADFLTAIKEFKPELILAGCSSMVLDGTGPLEQARQSSPDVPLIVIAEPAQKGAAMDAIKRGAADCIFKDRLWQLAPAVVRALREAEQRMQRRRAEVLLEVKVQQLSLQNEALRESEARFRQLAGSIQEVFWMTNVEKNETLYISPAYEEIWGRSCASLLAEPGDWMEALHPDDRDRVVKAVFEKQAAGNYDEQFRIVRPDGGVRWIHDRAFCVRDQTGCVYRLAGIAEDVTIRRQLEKQVLEVSDREQARLGRELHDSLCQLLVSIGFNTNALKKDLESLSAPGASSAERIAQRLSEAIKMARNLSHGLCLASSIGNNLGAALALLAQNTTADYGILCQAECTINDRFAAPDIATQVYRIAQEAVHNAVKHARASRIDLRLSAENGQAVLSVADDGCGFSRSSESGRSGLGLEIMKHRASVICGSLDVRPAAGESRSGTVVTCRFPPRRLDSPEGQMNGQLDETRS